MENKSLSKLINESFFKIGVEKGITPFFNRGYTGFIDSLLSAENRSGFNAIPSYGMNGGVSRLDFVYQQAFTAKEVVEYDINNVSDWDCNCMSAPLQTVDPSQFAQIISAPLTLTLAEMKLFKEDYEYRAKIISGLLNNMIKQLNACLIKEFYSKTPDSWNYSTMGTPYSSDNKIIDIDFNDIYYGYSKILQYFGQLGYASKPIIVGQGELPRGISFIIEMLSVDSRESINFWLDESFDANAPSPNTFLAYQYGALQLLTWNDNVGKNEISIPNLFERGVIIDPLTGLTFDLAIKFIDDSNGIKDENGNYNGYWTMQLSLKFALWGYPSDMYNDNGPMNGVTHNLSFNIV